MTTSDKTGLVLHQQGGLRSQLLNATPSLDDNFFDGNQTVMTSYQGQRAKMCRYLLNFAFIVGAFLFFSPFVFFILSFSIVKRFGEASTDSNGKNYDIFELVSVATICKNNGKDCFRFIYFAIYLTIFGTLFFVTIFLFLQRRDKHPLRFVLFCFVFFTFFYNEKHLYTDKTTNTITTELAVFVCYHLQCFQYLCGLCGHVWVLCTMLVGLAAQERIYLIIYSIQ